MNDETKTKGWPVLCKFDELAPISTVIPSPENPNRHPDSQLGLYQKILATGWRRAITVSRLSGHVVRGHGALEAARRGKQDVVPVEFQTYASAEEERADRLADNRLAELSERDEEAVARILSELKEAKFDITLAGFTSPDFDALLKELNKPESEKREAAKSLTERFGVPPFTVLDARQGYWQARKAKWVALGIASEEGRGGNLLGMSETVRANGKPTAKTFGREGNISESTGTSIFDPVLCELGYRWFCPPGGTILDPFAGGSVRGIVAGWLGFRYLGVDLREEQVAANRAQAAEIIGSLEAIKESAPESDFVEVKVSAANARQRFAGCEPDYIKNVCHASCCRSSTSPTGTVVSIHPREVAGIEALGGVVKDGLLQPKPGARRCPFQNCETHLCDIHFTKTKPFGCIASPFTLAKGGRTLIVRNRYRMLKCYDDGKRIPAYIAFRASLNLIFGDAEAQRIHEHLEAGGGDLIARMPKVSHATLLKNDATKHGDVESDEPAGKESDEPAGKESAKVMPEWRVGNSLELSTIAEGTEADLIFSCPPYADLEVYSDKPEDLSAVCEKEGYPAFLAQYREIIRQAVAKLRPNRFAVWVVGDVRDKAGFTIGFVPDTIRAFEDAGARFYNDAILVTSVGSLAIRAGRIFPPQRKLGRTHQNVLVFFKGDPKTVKEWPLPEFGAAAE